MRPFRGPVWSGDESPLLAGSCLSTNSGRLTSLAEEAEQVERSQQALAEEIKTCQQAMGQADESQRHQLEARIKDCRERLAALSKEKQ